MKGLSELASHTKRRSGTFQGCMTGWGYLLKLSTHRCTVTCSGEYHFFAAKRNCRHYSGCEGLGGLM